MTPSPAQLDREVRDTVKIGQRYARGPHQLIVRQVHRGDRLVELAPVPRVALVSFAELRQSYKRIGDQQ